MKFAKHIIATLLLTSITLHAGNVLCIGLNEYADYSNLNHAENDASEVARLFTALGHEVTLLTGADASLTNVSAAIAMAPEFIYFAGHGEKGRLILSDGAILLSDIANPDTTMFLDCCYVGGELKAAGTMKILAAAEYEAFESDGHGLFTKYLLNWLSDGKALVEDTLTAYLTRNIKAETGGWQKPVLGYI